MNIILSVVASLSIAIYTIAIVRLFAASGGIDWRMRLVQMTGATAYVVQVWHVLENHDLVVPQGLCALSMYGAGLWVFVAAFRALGAHRLTLAFSPDIPTFLIDHGIYSRIRHPFYTAYSLTWWAGVIAAPSVWTVAAAVVMCAQYVLAARLEEQKFLQSSLRTAYEAYRARAGMFWPVPGAVFPRGVEK